MPPRSERKERLMEYIQQELEESKAGQTGKFPLYRELAEQFGYADEHTVIQVIRRMGLQQEVKKIKLESSIVTPSKDWAWMIGLLSGKGHIEPNKGDIFYPGKNEDLLKAFQSIGERLFQKNTSYQFLEDKKNKRQYRIAKFSSVVGVRSMGNISGSKSPNTIIEKHSWILKDQKYLWSFLEGFFESRGYISYKPRKQIFFRFKNSSTANFIADLLVRVGINKLRINSYKDFEEVTIAHVKDLQVFAQNVHSKVQKKEERLKLLREYSPRYSKDFNATPEDLIQEWIKIKIILGHTPTSYEINKLRNENKTQYPYGVYSRLLGDGYFLKARKNLERIIAEREAEKSNNENSDSQETQIFP